MIVYKAVYLYLDTLPFYVQNDVAVFCRAMNTICHFIFSMIK